MSAREEERPGRPSGALVAFLLVAVGGGLLAFTASRPLGTGVEPSLRGAGSGGTGLGGAGVDTVGGPGATAVGVLGLAAAVAILAVRGWPRLTVGALTVLCALPVAVSRLVPAGGDGVTGATGATAPEAGPVWGWLVLAGAVTMAAGGVLTVSRGRGWSGLGARYERSVPGEGPLGPDDAPAARRTDDRSLWDDMDRGEDPTASQR